MDNNIGVHTCWQGVPSIRFTTGIASIHWVGVLVHVWLTLPHTTVTTFVTTTSE